MSLKRRFVYVKSPVLLPDCPVILCYDIKSENWHSFGYSLKKSAQLP